MAQRIRILPDEVVNRIAAGEVVERPASIVKELLENAIDARATEISVLVERGGLREIRVIDNGIGMSKDDALIAFKRHATSKIRACDDLAKMQTLGFRGEALPSIASVARVRMVTRDDPSLGGTEITLDAGRVKSIRETGCPRGTDFVAQDLFFNTPARRKFLRSVATEFSHIMEAVIRIALAYPSVHFRLFHNGRKVLDVPTTEDRLVRIGGLLGNEVYRVLRRVELRMDSLVAEAYLSDPVFTRPNPKDIYVYVNGRFIRDRIVHHALMEGYRNLVPKDRYPVAILFLRLPAEGVDVNVHPAKSEVRFRSTDLIHRSVVGLCQDLVCGSNDHGQAALSSAVDSGPSLLSIKESASSYGQPLSTAAAKMGDEIQTAPSQLLSGMSSSLRILGQLHSLYLVCESPRGLLLIDQHAAHERIVFERLKRQTELGKPQVQRLLFPEPVELSPLEWETVERYLPALSQLGLDLETFGRNTVVIQSVPSVLSGKDCAQVVSDLIRDLIEEEARGGAAKPIETAIRLTACHGAIRAGRALSHQEMMALLQEMEEEGFFSTCPHGRPACIEIDLLRLERMFGRSS